MTPLTDLIARLQAAPVGNADLDAEVLRAAGWRPAPGTSTMWIAPDDVWAKHVGEPTRSLNAITGLIEARGWEWFKDRPLHYDTGTALDGHAPLFYVGPRGGEEWTQHPSTPLALCIAFVRALEAGQ